MKPIRLTRRWLILLVLSFMSIAAAVAVSRDDPASGVVAVVDRSGGRAGPLDRLRENPPAQTAGGDQVTRLNARRIEDDLEPLFPALRKAAVVRPLAEEAPPAAPVAPPLPFRFLGRMIENGKQTLFLSMNDRNIVVQAGESIDDLYRVDSIENGFAAFTYLPLQQKQTLPIEESL